MLAADFLPVAISPNNTVWQRVWSHFLDAAMAGGWDPGYGARLCSDMHAAELVEVHANHVTRCHPGGSASSRLLSLTIERLKERMVQLGADSDEIDEARRFLDEPERTFTYPTTCVARGRRPAR